MAITSFTNAYVLVGATDLTDHCDKVTITTTKDLQEITAFGATNKSYVLGLGDASIECEFLQDFAAGKVDATLQPLQAGGTQVTVEIRPVNAARSATNPAYTLTAVLPEYTPMDAGVGDISKTTAKFVNATQTGLSRLTA